MNSYKKFTLLLFSILFCFYLYNLVVWKLFTENLMTDRYSVGGDLTRMGYILDAKHVRQNSYDLPRRHIEQEDYSGQKIDILTIGDSFSNGGGGGRNRYYQDYIASVNDMSVMNIEPYKDLDIVALTVAYLNNGYFDILKPQALIISSSEKFCIDRFSKKINFEKDIPLNSIQSLKRMGYRKNSADISPEGPLPQFGFINQGNFKFPVYSLYYRFSDHAFVSKTYALPLRMPLFSVKKGSTLLTYREDIKNLGRATPAAVRLMNDNFNTLADRLAAKGIRLYVMPCVDKYNLYSEFIVNNRHPDSTFFETLRQLPRRYSLIDTKEILQPEVRSGVMDIFYADDTHWSWKASNKIFSTIRFSKER